MPVPSYYITCTRKELIARDVYEMSFTKPADLSFLPGQFLLFDVPLMENPQDIQTRALSIASKPGDEELLFVIKLVPQGRLSRWIVEQAKLGSEVRIQGPFGNFLVDRKTSKNYLFVATGTGLAPFLPQVETLLLEGDKRAIDLVFGVRRKEDVFWMDRWHTLAARYPNFRIHLSLSDETEISSEWHSGRIQQIIPDVIPNLPERNIYLCGSPAMTKELRTLCLESWGVPKQDIHMEGYI